MYRYHLVQYHGAKLSRFDVQLGDRRRQRETHKHLLYTIHSAAATQRQRTPFVYRPGEDLYTYTFTTIANGVLSLFLGRGRNAFTGTKGHLERAHGQKYGKAEQTKWRFCELILDS